MISIVTFIVLIILFSFLCSMAEAAILSVPLLRVRIMVEQKRPGAKDLLYIKENISQAIATLVIINNSVNIIGSMYIGHQVSFFYSNHWVVGAAAGFVTFLIILFGEVIPKAFGERFKNTISLLVAKVVRVLMGMLNPFVKVSTSILRLWGSESKTFKVTEEEIKMMLKMGREEGTLSTDEVELCSRVFRLKDVKAAHVMKPLRDAYMLPADKTLAELKDKIISSPYNRIVVYDNSLTNVVGIVQHRILLREMARENHNSKVSQWMLKPIYVHHMMKIDALMEKFQSFHQHLFIVRDNMNKNIGLVTMEDVLEELFGEIFDEKDIRFRNLLKTKENEQ